MIGVFWIYKSQIYGKTINTVVIKEVNKFIDSNFSHYQVWSEVSLKDKDFYLYEYEDIPRGRVIYDMENEQYIVYANEEIINSDIGKMLIIDMFSLQKSKVSFKYDEHYKIRKL